MGRQAHANTHTRTHSDWRYALGLHILKADYGSRTSQAEDNSIAPPELLPCSHPPWRRHILWTLFQPLAGWTPLGYSYPPHSSLEPVSTLKKMLVWTFLCLPLCGPGTVIQPELNGCLNLWIHGSTEQGLSKKVKDMIADSRIFLFCQEQLEYHLTGQNRFTNTSRKQT